MIAFICAINFTLYYKLNHWLHLERFAMSDYIWFAGITFLNLDIKKEIIYEICLTFLIRDEEDMSILN